MFPGMCLDAKITGAVASDSTKQKEHVKTLRPLAENTDSRKKYTAYAVVKQVV